jgi:hypothetical protein
MALQGKVDPASSDLPSPTEPMPNFPTVPAIGDSPAARYPCCVVITWEEFDNQEPPGPKWSARKARLFVAWLGLLVIALLVIGTIVFNSVWFDLIVVVIGLTLWYLGVRLRRKRMG